MMPTSRSWDDSSASWTLTPGGALGRRREERARSWNVRQPSLPQILLERRGEFRLAAAIVRQRQPIDHRAACSPVAGPPRQHLEHVAEHPARERLVAMDQTDRGRRNGLLRSEWMTW